MSSNEAEPFSDEGADGGQDSVEKVEDEVVFTDSEPLDLFVHLNNMCLAQTNHISFHTIICHMSLQFLCGFMKQYLHFSHVKWSSVFSDFGDDEFDLEIHFEENKSLEISRAYESNLRPYSDPEPQNGPSDMHS